MQELKIHTQSPWVEYLQYEKQKLLDVMALSVGDPGRRGKAALKPLLERLWGKVKTDVGDCWYWLGATNRDRNDLRNEKWPYGKIGITWGTLRITPYVHRLVYELYNGPVPHGLLVRHSCDNTLCVRPEHLIIGTDKDNTHDSIRRGRFPIGETVYCSKLTAEKIIQIRTRVRAGEMQKTLAVEFGVNHATIGDAVNRRTWKQVT